MDQPNVRFIKLGFGGTWAEDCIKNNLLRLGYESDLHEECLRGNWNAVHEVWKEHRKGNSGTASRDINQIRDFYEQPESTIWITFHNQSMYWCKAEKELQVHADGTRTRKFIGSWSNTSEKGQPLSVRNLDGRVTVTQAFRGTICGVNEADYVIRKIKGEEDPLVTQVEQTRKLLVEQTEHLVKGLSWQDFELLVDLLLARAGWSRQSVLGGTVKDIDATNATGDRNAFIQIKSQTNLDGFKHYVKVFEEHVQYQEMFFVYHTLSGKREEIDAVVESRVPDGRSIRVWGGQEVSELVVKLGLLDWLIAKRS